MAPIRPRNTRANGYDQLWTLLHKALLLRSGASSSKPDGNIHHLKPSTMAPTSACPEIIELEQRWEGAKGDAAKRAVLRDTYSLLRHYTVPTADPKRLRGTKEWREAIAFDPRSSRTVAEMYGVSHQTVCDFRRQFPESRRAGSVK